MQKGIITIEIENITLEDTRRYQDIIQTMFEQGAFSIFNGSANLHFRLGELDSIDLNLYTYKRNKENIPLQEQKSVLKVVRGLRETTGVL
jgi:hypothetical protein